MSDLAIAVEIGGTKLQAAAGRTDGIILDVRRESVDPSGGAAGILQWVEDTVRVLIEELGGPERLHAIGVGFGGPVESATGRVLTSHQVEGWRDVALKHWFESHFHVPTVVANDANAAGWAEYCLGAGRGTRHFFYSNIGSGIGGALVIDGRLHDGQGLGAGEVGHTYVPDWTKDEHGAADKLEHLCSGWSIERRLRSMTIPSDSILHHLCSGRTDTITCAILGKAASQGDQFAVTEIDRVAQSIGLALANVITLFHPERIALGGGVSLMGEVLLEPVRRHVAERVFGPFQDAYEIVPCTLGEAVVLSGALLLAGGQS